MTVLFALMGDSAHPTRQLDKEQGELQGKTREYGEMPRILPKIGKVLLSGRELTASSDKIPLSSVGTSCCCDFSQDSQNYQGAITEFSGERRMA
jgi:hypothetical protein